MAKYVTGSMMSHEYSNQVRRAKHPNWTPIAPKPEWEWEWKSVYENGILNENKHGMDARAIACPPDYS